METNRRRFLLGTAAGAASLALGCEPPPETADEPAPGLPTEPDPWEPGGADDAAAFPYGLQVGDATPDGAVLSCRTAEPGIAFQVVAESDGSWVEVARLGPLDPVDGVVQAELSGLEADRAHRVVAWAADGERRSRVVRFRTALPEDGWRQVLLACTCCLGGNEPWPNLSAAAAQRPDLALLIGDTVYADDAVTLDDYRAYYDAALSTLGLLDLTAATSLAVTWDDHEVGNNWTPQTVDPDRLAAALQAFDEALPRRRGGGAAGIWRVLRWGRVADVFLLDCRSERDAEAGLYLSREQMDWLKEELLASTARFKVIANSVPIADYTSMLQGAAAEDRWEGFPEARAEILDHLLAHDIRGVLWLSGDQHYGGLQRLDPPGGPYHGMCEVMCGPGGSRINPAAELYPQDEQFVLLLPAWNTVTVLLDPGTGTARVQWLGDDGLPLAEELLRP